MLNLYVAIAITLGTLAQPTPVLLAGLTPAVIHEKCPLPSGWAGYEASVGEYLPTLDLWTLRFPNGKIMLVSEIEGPDIRPGDPVIVMVTPEGHFFKAFLNAERPPQI